MIAWLISKLAPGILDRVLSHVERRADSETERARISAGREAVQVGAYRDIATIEAGRFWSATSIGRLLIVVPFGLWWAAIFVDSVFDLPWSVLALPPQIQALAEWLVPAIILADAGERVGRAAMIRR